ncbi:MAG: Mu transposase domain-containing protein [Pseudonocardiaceae bacterium]
MPYVRDSFWRGRQFVSQQHMQEQALVWCREVAGTRSCRPLGGAAPATVFAAVGAEALKTVAAQAFVLATWSVGKVGPDIHVKVSKTLYSVPWRHIGRTVDARETPDGGADLRRRGVDRHPRPQTGGQANRPVTLFTGEDRAQPWPPLARFPLPISASRYS